jgi:hypothetical protein
MKKILYCFLVVFLSACAEKPLDVDQARLVAQELITRTYEGKLDGIEELYTAAFNASEPAEIKKDKLTRLMYTLGAVKNMEFVSFTHKAEFGEPQQVVLTYRIQHARATAIETITVMKDDGGYKVAAHMVETEG